MVTETEDGGGQAHAQGTMDPARLVAIFLLVMAIVGGMFLEQMIGLALAGLSISDPNVIEGLDWRASTLVGYAIAIGLAVWIWVAPRSKAYAFDVASELMLVTWPGWTEVRTSTTAVVVASAIAALIIFAIDNFALRLMVEWLPAVWTRL